MIVSAMQQQDIAALAQLEQTCFSQPWSAQSLQEQLTHTQALFLVAKKDERVLGYVGCHWVLDEGYITNIAVFPNCRRCGVARALLQALLTQAQQKALTFVTLEVRASNASAIALYRTAGFETVGVRKAYYTTPTEDAHLMTYTFTGKE